MRERRGALRCRRVYSNENLNLTREHLGNFLQHLWACCVEIGGYGPVDVAQCCLYRFALRHATGQLRNVSHVPFVLWIIDEVDEEMAFHATIVRENWGKQLRLTVQKFY